MGLDYSILKINVDNVSLVQQFISSAGTSLNKFRYYQSRPFSVIKNHLVTCIVTVDNNAVGYGHLDKDGENVWLGIAIAERFVGHGFGELIMQFLISNAKSNYLSKIKLTVDSDNLAAKNLYMKLGFISTGKVNDDTELMELRIAHE